MIIRFPSFLVLNGFDATFEELMEYAKLLSQSNDDADVSFAFFGHD